uniref:GST N-terminal domain-containing protein n=1 Tax=Helicotheca tamesis TaxID=374047 RepID=A0A7S2H5U2_9STRA|mmetsp:Transcript_15516/g.21179  ORF Transcript_15516/g.21179 Transcript_15516/m.21179 type:complete len:306 (+) Transcript_15516:133-1050(+)|eukprot:CAMPEP_0185728902 /NCGR_PEP_ID=MMETSP1171-20130828/4314_1 /TAXON_ID=374046 /ORGANISM="Helicotheca tamensis, Strain CCMP826" /LENGTH=305 /DNA_ID=CAMNT_0028397655 /DNA_START=133 /DNA_END=1050 /DNA_ORIENTATION=+
MKLAVSTLLLAIASTGVAFTAPSVKTTSTFASTKALSMSSAAVEAESFTKGPRIIRDELPIAYVYDHCPFCVRVRLALGVKNVKHNLQFLANDDIPTPTKLIGKKIAPIFAIPEDDFIMGESLDIIEKVDTDERFGETNQIKPASGRTDIKAWQKSVQTLLRTLQRPRYVATGLLPEFQQLDGRHAFIKNHQLPPYEKKEWKGDGSEDTPGMDMDEKLNLYAEAMAKDPAPLVEDLNAKLIELDDIIYSEHYCTEGGFSMDDIDLWSRLRSITIVKGVDWPVKLRAYMDNLSALGDVPLYDNMAL